MDNDQIVLLSLAMSVLSLLGLAGALYFGIRIYRESRSDLQPHWDRALHIALDRAMDQDPNTLFQYVQALSDIIADNGQRRNEFWTMSGQILLSVLVIAVLTVLLLTGSISAEAGLPILSGVSGFAIAKTTGAARRSTAAPFIQAQRG